MQYQRTSARGTAGMTDIYADRVLTAEGWRKSVRIQIRAGRIGAVATGVHAEPGDDRCGVVVPALGNLHSHAFQRGMAGLAETAGSSADSFWSWREVMYRFALRMNPDQLQAIAALAYVEMMEAGFGRVGEFHYLHHDCDGTPYADVGEMAGRIAAAAEQSGIGLTLLPVFYAHSTFGGAAPSDKQRRFISTLDRYQILLERCRALVARLPAAIVGMAPHSLRAVTPDEMLELAALGSGSPVHIHIAEQEREVQESLAWSGQRPVAWLFDHVPVSSNWCLVHSTHVTEEETRAIAAARAIVGLCPVTEANLGDGVFPIARFLSQGGSFGIGTDSNVHISVSAELSLLEYAQRLEHRTRNVISMRGGDSLSTGRAIMQLALSGGAQALGAGGGRIAPGEPADLLSLDLRHPALFSRDSDALLDSWIFASSGAVVDSVWVAGRKQVSHGRHVARDEAQRTFNKAMQELCH